MDLLPVVVLLAVLNTPLVVAQLGLFRLRRQPVPAGALLALALLAVLPHLALAAEVAKPGVGHQLKDWGLGLLALLALPAAFVAARKALEAYLGREIPNLLHKLLDAGDEDDDTLVYALARWADRKAAKLGAAGDTRFLPVAADLCARVKILRGQEARLAELLAAAVKAAGAAADRVADERDAAPPSPPEPPAA